MTASAAIALPGRADLLAQDAERHFAENPNALWMPIATPAFSRIGQDNLGAVYEDEALAFPNVKAPYQPLGCTVLVLLRQPPMGRAGGAILLSGEMRRTERDNTQVAKVVAVGPLAFRSRDTGELWPEGAWCAVGDYVRVPKYQGDRTAVRYKCKQQRIDPITDKVIVEDVEDTVEFVQFKDLAILGRFEDAQAALANQAYI